MGGKTWLLANGLGRELSGHMTPGTTFVDLFAGSGAVAQHVASEHKVRVEAYDTQAFAAALSKAIVGRRRKLNADALIDGWVKPVRQRRDDAVTVRYSRKLLTGEFAKRDVLAMRMEGNTRDEVFSRSYAGHYLSLEQTWCIDELRASLPESRQQADVALAALIMATSRCSASPGHTAQPFQPTDTALPHIENCWSRDLLDITEAHIRELSDRVSRSEGHVAVADANETARRLKGGEVVFLDPPYSAAQYSRFYHVLEAVAIGGFKEVFGAGRAPALSDRSRSRYSCVATARRATDELLADLAAKQCTVILTFPKHKASNGMSGQEVIDEASSLFQTSITYGSSRFSTLGGNGQNRAARHSATEVIATLRPRQR